MKEKSDASADSAFILLTSSLSSECGGEIKFMAKSHLHRIRVVTDDIATALRSGEADGQQRQYIFRIDGAEEI